MSKFNRYSLSDCLEKIIDYRGKTPLKLGHTWSASGYKALSALNIKTTGLANLDSVNYASEELYKKWMKVEVQKGDILLTSEAPAGQVMLWNTDEKIVLSQRLFALRTKTSVHNVYLKYFLQSSFGQNEIKRNTSGSTVFGISVKMFDLINVYLPNIPTQQKIAAVLSALDDKIELNNKINSELEQLAKTIYDYWFVQFDFPDANGQPYKSSGGKMVWNAELKREVPEGWEVKKMGELGEFKNGINYDPSEPGDINAKIINVRNISASTLFVLKEDLDEINLKSSNVKKYLVDDNSILIARSGIPGATRLIDDYDPNTIYCGFIICFNVVDSSLKNLLFFNLKNLEKITTRQSGGTIMQNVNQETLKRIAVPIEINDMSKIKRFNKIINPLFDKINLLSKQNQQLSQLRDWLLPMLMNGQVTVGQAYEMVAEQLPTAAEGEAGYSKKEVAK